MRGSPGTSTPLCRFHRKGVPARVQASDFFEPGCPTCEDKRTRGVVTGTEPPPSHWSLDRKMRMAWVMKAKRNQDALCVPQPRRGR